MKRLHVPKFEVRGSGRSWNVFQDGQAIGGVSTCLPHALTKQDKIEKRYRIANARQRPCITCGCAFKSEGPHNRMCDRCRHV